MLSAGGAAVPATSNFQNKLSYSIEINKYLVYLKLSMNLTVFLSNGTVVPPLYERIFESILIALTKALGRKYRNKSNARPFLSMILNKGFHIILSLGKIRRLRRMGVEYIRIRGVFLHLSSLSTMANFWLRGIVICLTSTKSLKNFFCRKETEGREDKPWTYSTKCAAWWGLLTLPKWITVTSLWTWMLTWKISLQWWKRWVEMKDQK